MERRKRSGTVVVGDELVVPLVDNDYENAVFCTTNTESEKQRMYGTFKKGNVTAHYVAAKRGRLETKTEAHISLSVKSTKRSNGPVVCTYA